MKFVLGLLVAVACSGAMLFAGQAAGGSPDAHVARARTAAGDTYRNLFDFLCAVPAARGAGPRGGGARAGGPPPGPPARSTWFVEPVKVFDNLYFVGQSEYSAWAITTTQGIILIDALFDYSVEAEVVDGLKKLGLDPAAIRYLVVTHPHPDHHGGAQLLQERYGARVIMSPADWDVIERLLGSTPVRDIHARDAQALTLGDTTIRLYITPGHTPGTISLLIPVVDNGRRHLAAMWGGTGLNADAESLGQYIRSAQRFRDIAAQAGADVLLSNHTDWDGGKVYLPQMATRATGSRHPYVVGPAMVRRYLDVAEQCATARLLRARGGN